jgi:hypothetical protein
MQKCRQERSSTQADSRDAKPDASVAAYPRGRDPVKRVRSLRSAERPVNEESPKKAKYFRCYKTITISARACTWPGLMQA